MLQPRQFLVLLSLAVSAAFALVTYVTLNNPGQSWGHGPEHLDLERYRSFRSLSADEFPTDDPHRRVILLGDIHGMDKGFRQLLDKVAYDHQNDVLIHTGDIITRGSHKGSLAVVDFMTTHNVTGVRGNNDQNVIEWKGWLDWFCTLPGAAEWLSELESAWLMDRREGHKLKPWIKSRRRASRGRDAIWWEHIPKGWVPFSDHYRVAKDLTEEQYTYLTSLPLKIHVPSAHTFIIHAGLLPCDVRYDYDDHRRQPLARMPRIGSMGAFHDGKTEALRNLQELAILLRVPQNTNPWVNLNMRSILKDNSVSRSSKKGTPWNHYWNFQMSLCDGFHPEKVTMHIQDPDSMSTSSGGPDRSLPCYPASVIYGHAASRGLDLKRHSIGLDTGCVYGRKLTAMILGPNPLPRKEEWEEVDYNNGDENNDELSRDAWMDLEDDEAYDDDYDVPNGKVTVINDSHSLKRATAIKFGEHSTAKLVDVSCS